MNPKNHYTREEFIELQQVLRESSNHICQSFGVVLSSMVDKEFSFSVNPSNVGSIQGHQFLYENYPERYAMIFLRKLSMLPTEMNNDDPVINEIVLWRIRKGKGE